ncbi:[protein-PII] uridylyltransferase [Marivibrio halodurans]|uniref:Bifunctional uridylyltransferase/uridylyl-removing enzyme n=1 Tax=Marivibrio halodurans TaxID=2039722 RepID=A0A8J7S1B8_9PROT|nr:[protein-PII] uridylyltransferase [Marivibrio halodurans]MBP5858070.1 [protein-PII] uridylyltransferase [Marivibrio halodurans]
MTSERPAARTRATPAASGSALGTAPGKSSGAAQGQLPNRRRIINRLALTQALDAAVESAASADARRTAWLGILKDALSAGRGEVERRFFEDQDGAAAVAGNCFLIDQLLRVLYDATAQHLYPAANPTEAEKICLVAVGGYGRGELAPYSDVDILFLHHYKPSARIEQMVEEILYMLWDLGLTVGQSTRSIDECLRQAKSDWTIATALLEARYVWGEKGFFGELKRRFRRQFMETSGPDFLDAKLTERDERHARLGDSRYVMEPNIKDGKGGLRDLHTLFWAAKFLYKTETIEELAPLGVLTSAEIERFRKAQQFLWTLRCHLHYLARRAEERLTFDVQPELARRMLYTDHAGASGVERFMKHYFLIAKEVGDLTRIFLAAFEAQHKRRGLFRLPANLFKREIEGFPLESGRLSITGRQHFAERPVDMLRLFLVAHEHDVAIHPDALAQVTRSLRRVAKLRDDPEANRIFLDILAHRRDPEATLRLMNECDLFGKFLPDFGRVVAQMQYDMYHVYTTDEHTIRAIGILNRIENGVLKEDHPLSSEVIHQLSARRVLYVALLLHDIAKGRGGDHSELGAKVAKRVCPRLGLDAAETETVAWLVLHHLAMSMTAFKRDLEDPKTVRDFVDLVKSPERLRLLLCLTVCDIRAVGPSVWNNWKATLLRELYYRVEEMMTGSSYQEGRRKRAGVARAKLADALEEAGWPQADIESHLDRGPDSYFLSLDPDTLVRHARIVRDAVGRDAELTLETRVDEDRAVTELTIYCVDHPGLFSRLTGAMAVAGASVVDAKIATLTNGMALDTFLIQDAEGGAFSRPDRLAKLSVHVDRALSGKMKPVEELRNRTIRGFAKRARVLSVPPRVIVDNKASNTHTVVEVNGRDRPGLLHRLAYALTGLGLQISTAKISTYGEQVVDVFYVKDVFGMKVDHRGKLESLRTTLMGVLIDPEEKDGAPSGPATPITGRAPKLATGKARRSASKARAAKAGAAAPAAKNSDSASPKTGKAGRAPAKAAGAKKTATKRARRTD